ncbi:hypothetical protein SAMN05444158_1259 [Bradyrhizobium canariense]|uniref:Uncharacterized protein n=1 Tax=Bradyrhizobium canariense TaxID=255045 RepID=A0A1H1Q3Y9_9BRAD|nr:hypothetical protein SAMN05444158_1259 [Bradyrhizobium canariense]
MFGKWPSVAALKQVGRLLALLACAILLPENADAADLRLRIKPTAERHDTTPAPETRERLFEQFLRWVRSHQPG